MHRITLVLLLGAAACATSSQGVNTVPTTTTTSTTSTSSASPSGSQSRTVTTTVTTNALNPLGTYAIQSEINTQPVTGIMTIRGDAANYLGSISVHGQGDFPITSGKVVDRTLTFTFDTPNGTGTAKLLFAANNEFTGAWELAGQTGAMTGKRTP